MRRLIADAGLGAEFVVDSAGTGGWHAGEAPDARAVAAGARRGYDVCGSARQVETKDFVDFDLIVGMDHANLRAMRGLNLDLESRLKVRLLLDGEDVADPYSGSVAAFDDALELIERGCRELLAELTAAPL
jgi:protein-tyrosine phosphatase